MKKEQQIGINFEILFTIIFINAVAMFLISIIAFNVLERIALDGKADRLESLISTFENNYYKPGNVNQGIDFLENTLEKGAWGIFADGRTRMAFQRGKGDTNNLTKTDPLILEVMRTGDAVKQLKGFNLPPFIFHESIKYAKPINGKHGNTGILFINQPLGSLRDDIISGQQQIAVWIILFLLVIALLSFYVLSRRIVRPIKELIVVTEKISIDEFPDDVDIGNVRELNQLSTALKTMYLQIRESKEELRKNIEALEESNRVIQRTQKELTASDKLASLGRLSAGVAHEIGNPLSGILGYIEILNRSNTLTEEDKSKFISNIKNETLRIDRIIKTLLDYAKPRDLEISSVNINAIITSTINLLRTQGVFNNLDLEINLDDSIKNIEADPHQLSQVIINLVLNARDALTVNGKISIKSLRKDEGGVDITIWDNGSGIPSDQIDKIFDPFYTTKDPGKGTGLGLSVSARIVQLFGGNISVNSGEGVGTTFKISFS